MTEVHYLDSKYITLRKLEMAQKGFTLKSREIFKNGRCRLVFVKKGGFNQFKEVQKR